MVHLSAFRYTSHYCESSELYFSPSVQHGWLSLSRCRRVRSWSTLGGVIFAALVGAASCVTVCARCGGFCGFAVVCGRVCYSVRPLWWRLFLVPIIHTKRTKTTRNRKIFFKKLKMVNPAAVGGLVCSCRCSCCSAAFPVAALVGFWAAFLGKVLLYCPVAVRSLGKEKPPIKGGFSGLGL